MDKITYEPGSFYIFDRGYIDFERLYVIELAKSFFVIRSRKKLKFKRLRSQPANKLAGVMSDQIGILTVFNSQKGYPKEIRKILFYDEERNIKFIFLTNNFDLQATEIALLYKHRWKIELFFKWIKQHLKIKTFWGTTENAVKVQTYVAIITYTLVAIIKQKVKSEYSTYEVLQILGSSLLDKTPIRQLLKKHEEEKSGDQLYKQLEIW